MEKRFSNSWTYDTLGRVEIETVMGYTTEWDYNAADMPTLWIPTPLRNLTQGNASVTVAGSSVREAIENLEAQFPGIRERLCEEDRVRPNISVFVNGTISHLKMRERLEESSEVHFVIAISGG